MTDKSTAAQAVPVKTTQERVAALRQRRSEAGLVRLELYAHPDDHAPIKDHAAKLQAKREKAGKKAAKGDE